MHDLDRLRELFPEPATPTDEAKQQASARLAQAIHNEEAQRRNTAGDKQTLSNHLLRLIRTRPRSSALALATLVAAAAAALFISAPWSNSPGLLERAEAALTPAADMVLHMKWDTTSAWTRRFCRVVHGQGEVWVDGAEPHGYRLLLDLPNSADPRTLGCASAMAGEYGGSYRSGQTLQFVPPNRLRVVLGQFRFPLDPAGDIRKAINAGKAHDEGKTQLDGRTVERIRIDPPPPPCSYCPSDHPQLIHAYLDPETFYPVEIVATHYQVEIVGGPGGSSYSHVAIRDVTRFQAVEYLPRSAANIALTDIRAQHPNATGP